MDYATETTSPCQNKRGVSQYLKELLSDSSGKPKAITSIKEARALVAQAVKEWQTPEDFPGIVQTIFRHLVVTFLEEHRETRLARLFTGTDVPYREMWGTLNRIAEQAKSDTEITPQMRQMLDAFRPENIPRVIVQAQESNGRAQSASSKPPKIERRRRDRNGGHRLPQRM